MNRRTFSKLAAAGWSAFGLADGPRAGGGRIKLGTQNQSSDEMLRILAALGVAHICSELPPRNSMKPGQWVA
jgi:hypothetical protein